VSNSRYGYLPYSVFWVFIGVVVFNLNLPHRAPLPLSGTPSHEGFRYRLHDNSSVSM
jgi:hypothetical protein